MNSHYFCDVILQEAKRAVTVLIGKSWIESMMIRIDNCKVHNSAKTTKRLEEF
jgi:hypothetical protein